MRWSIRRTLPRSSWTGIGPAALMLTLAGAGVSSIIPGVRAQEAIVAAPKSQPLTVAVKAAPLVLQNNAPLTSKPLVVVVGQPVVTLQPPPPPTLQTPSIEPQDKDTQSSDDQRKLRSQLRDLMKQRTDLDSRIADLRRRLGESDLYTPYSSGLGEFRSGDNAFYVAPYANNRKLTPEERKQAEEAMKQAQEAMRAAQKAMEQAQKAMGNNMTLYRSVMPQIQEKLRVLQPDTIPVPALPDVHVYRWSQDDQKKFEQDWAKQQPDFERAMRDFQARMEKWAEDFEARMRREFGTKNGDKIAPPADNQKDTAPQKENRSPDKDQDTGGDIL